jgi:hypothetical protein
MEAVHHGPSWDLARNGPNASKCFAELDEAEFLTVMLLTDPMFHMRMLACVTVIGLWVTVFSNYEGSEE